MNVSVREVPGARIPPLAWLAAGLLSVVAGLAVGVPDAGLLALLSVLAGLGIVAFVTWKPFTGFLAMVYSVFLLMVITVPGTERNLNVLDLVLIPTLVGTFLGWSGRRAGVHSGRGGPAEADLVHAERRFSNAVLLYFGWAVVSLLWLAVHAGAGPALDSAFSLARNAQGALIFPLGVWWLRTERRIQATLGAIFLAATVFAVVNCVFVFALHAPRAGLVWWVAEVEQAIGSPNEAGGALVVLWALLQAKWAVRRERWLIPLMVIVVAMLPLTQSRSGLLAFATFLILTVRRVRWTWVLIALGSLAAMLPLLPGTLWVRLGNTFALKQGSFELFSFLIRVYGYRIAWQVFLQHPLLGVGYQGFMPISPAHNPFHLTLIAENFFLNTLTGLGLVGFVLAIMAFVRLFALGAVAQRAARPGTFGHELARRHVPFMVALVVVNTTGNSLVGLVGIGQVALWCALLVRASRSHSAAESRA